MRRERIAASSDAAGQAVRRAVHGRDSASSRHPGHCAGRPVPSKCPVGQVLVAPLVARRLASVATRSSRVSGCQQRVQEVLIPAGDVTTRAHAVFALVAAQQVAGHVLDGGEVRGRVPGAGPAPRVTRLKRAQAPASGISRPRQRRLRRSRICFAWVKGMSTAPSSRKLTS